MDAQKLDSSISEFIIKKKSNAAYYEENWDERKERKEYYQSFTKDKLLAMTEEEFLEYISKLWSMLIWGNKKYVVDKLIADNGFTALKKQLAELLYGISPIEKRWDLFLKSVKGMGPATISELLTYANPQEYVIFNKTTILCFGYLDIPDMPKYNYQYTGKKYKEVCTIAKEIAQELEKSGAENYDLLAVDYFLWDEILPLAEKKSQSPEAPVSESKKPTTISDSKSLHDEIKEKLVAIGELLGFDSRSEVKIILFRHSVLIARMKFSMRAFICGVNGGNFLISMLMDSKTESNLLLKSGSRSWIRYFLPSMKPSHISHMFLAICVVQLPSGL